MDFLAKYELESGQLINKAKSCFVVGSKASVVRRNCIATVTGFQYKELPISYLGVRYFVEERK